MTKRPTNCSLSADLAGRGILGPEAAPFDLHRWPSLTDSCCRCWRNHCRRSRRNLPPPLQHRRRSLMQHHLQSRPPLCTKFGRCDGAKNEGITAEVGIPAAVARAQRLLASPCPERHAVQQSPLVETPVAGGIAAPQEAAALLLATPARSAAAMQCHTRLRPALDLKIPAGRT